MAVALTLPLRPQVIIGTPFGGGGGAAFNGGTVANATTFQSQVRFPVGSVGTPSITNDDVAGIWFRSSGGLDFTADGTNTITEMIAGAFRTSASVTYGWASGDGAATALDTGLARNAAGVVRVSDGANSIRGLLGGGTVVASANALPVPTGGIFHVSGTTNVTSITSTNFAAGCIVTIIFDGVLTFTDGNNLKLAGNFTTAADATITLAYDGSNWFEVARSTN